MMRPFETALSVIVSLALAAAVLLLAGCEPSQDPSAAHKNQGHVSRCAEFTHATKRSGVQVTCTMLLCYGTIATLFCDEVPK